MTMNDADRKYIDDKFVQSEISIKASIKENVDHIKDVFDEKLNNALIPVQMHTTQISSLETVQQKQETSLTRLWTKFDGHLENHSTTENKKKAGIGWYITIGIAVIGWIITVIIFLGSGG